MSDYQPSPPQPTPPQAIPYAQGSAPQPATPILSILALIFGIIGVLSAWLFVGGLPAIAAIVLGFIARRREPAAKGMWLTGIITGFVGVLELIVVIGFYVALIVFAMNNPDGFS